MSIKENGWKDTEIVLLVEIATNKLLKNIKAGVREKFLGIKADVLAKDWTDDAKAKLKTQILAGTNEITITDLQSKEINREIAKLLEQAPERNVLIVDTKHGKAAYFLIFDPEIGLGRPTVYYEFVDFFRDDLNPKVLSIFKYQLFSWTLVAIVLYIYKFLQLNQAATSLPEISSTVVILTGVSTAGYLAGKFKPA